VRIECYAVVLQQLACMGSAFFAIQALQSSSLDAQPAAIVKKQPYALDLPDTTTTVVHPAISA